MFETGNLFMKKVSNPSDFIKKIKKLIADKIYLGEITTNGFIIKRNYGVRRLAVYGQLNAQKDLIIKAKNEILFQISYYIGIVILLILICLLFYIQNYKVALLCLSMLILIILAENHQRQKEIKQLLKNVANMDD